MKTTFKLNPRHAAIAASLLSVSCLHAHAAATVSAPEIRSEIRTVIVDGDAALEQLQGNGEALISRSSGEGKREVRIISKNGASQVAQFDFADMPDVNVIMSNAVSEAFAGGAALPMGKSIKNAPYSAEVISEKI
ncbi:MAG: hypothetical protein ABI905_12610, partial [Betaproteobacteria bacterium]